MYEFNTFQIIPWLSLVTILLLPLGRNLMVNSLQPICHYTLSFLPLKQWLNFKLPRFYKIKYLCLETQKHCTRASINLTSLGTQAVGRRLSRKEKVPVDSVCPLIKITHFQVFLELNLPLYSHWCSHQPLWWLSTMAWLTFYQSCHFPYLWSFLCVLDPVHSRCQLKILFPSCHFLTQKQIASVPQPFYLLSLSPTLLVFSPYCVSRSQLFPTSNTKRLLKTTKVKPSLGISFNTIHIFAVFYFAELFNGIMYSQPSASHTLLKQLLWDSKYLIL